MQIWEVQEALLEGFEHLQSHKPHLEEQGSQQQMLWCRTVGTLTLMPSRVQVHIDAGPG